MYRVTITYKFRYPFEDKEEYYKESERYYREDYIKALEIYEKSKELKNVHSCKLERIEKVEEWVNE